jgi:hypothetical protein
MKTKKKSLVFFFCIALSVIELRADDSIYWALTPGTVYRLFNGSVAWQAKAPTNRYKFQRCEYLITKAEMEESGFLAGAIRSMGFWNKNGGTSSLRGLFKIYLKNTGDLTYSLGNAWTTEGFSMIYCDSNYKVQDDQGIYGVNLNPDSTFFYHGEGLYVAWEFSRTQGDVAAFLVNWAWCNIDRDSLQHGAWSMSSLPGTLAVSMQRPATWFSREGEWIDLVRVTNINVLERTMLNMTSPDPIHVWVSNCSDQTLTFDLKLQVTDSATGTIRYGTSQLVSDLSPGAVRKVTFAGWSPVVAEKVVYTASTSDLVGETFLANNACSVGGEVTTDRFSWCEDINAPITYLGAVWPGSIIMAVKFSAGGPMEITGLSARLAGRANFAGNQCYAALIGSEGDILARSPMHTTIGEDTISPTVFTFPVPAELYNETFYAGIGFLAGPSQWSFLAATWGGLGNEQQMYWFAPEGGTNPYERPYGVRLLLQATASQFNGIMRPKSLRAHAENESTVTLNWKLNYRKNRVLLAWSADSVFGVPQEGRIYFPGDTISGGGEALAFGSDTLYNHEALQPGAACYYKLWSFDGNGYSRGVESRAVTLCKNDTVFPVTESFDDPEYPPSCWSADRMYRTTHGLLPAVLPHSGEGMVTFQAGSQMPGDKGTLTAPPVILTNDNFKVKFWMYRDSALSSSQYSSYKDRLDVLVGENPDGSWADSLGTIYRDRRLEPVESSAGWFEYTFGLGPANPDRPKFVFLRGVSTWNHLDIFLDDVSIFSTSQGIGDDSPANSAVLIYPNPTGDDLHFVTALANKSGTISYQVLDLPGHIVLQGVLPSGTRQKLTIADLSQGIYILKITGDGHSCAAKFIKSCEQR